MNVFFPSIEKIHGAYYPHWRAVGAAYFVTYRLAGSIPSSAMKDIAFRRREIFSTAALTKRSLSEYEEDELEDLHFKELSLMHYDRGACFLKDPRIAKIIADAFRHFDGQRYSLFAWVVMSTHVHVVVQPYPGWELSAILHSWKSFTARKSNEILRRTGAFWQREYYDHLIRNEDDLQRCIAYTWANPEKAGLRGYKWRWKKDVV